MVSDAGIFRRRHLSEYNCRKSLTSFDKGGGRNGADGWSHFAKLRDSRRGKLVELLVSSYSSMNQRLYKLVSGNSTFPANFARLMITKWRQETKLFPFKEKRLQILKMMIKVSINSNQRFPRCRIPFQRLWSEI